MLLSAAELDLGASDWTAPGMGAVAGVPKSEKAGRQRSFRAKCACVVGS